jgi:hypothetical protein
MSMRKLLTIVVAAMIVPLLVIMPLNAYPAAAAAPLSGGKTIAVVPGEYSQELAALIAKYADSEIVSGFNMASSADVVVFSGMNSALGPQAISAINRGAITVIAGAPDDFDNKVFSVPVMTVSIEKTSLETDAQTGALVSTKTLGTTKEQAVVPGYLVYVLYDDGEVSHSSCFAALTDSSTQREYVSEDAAQKVASILLEPASLNQGSTDQWTKKRDSEDTYTINDQGDQLYSLREVYQLNYWDEVANKDYWRVDSTVDHYLPSYQKDLFECGPYMDQRGISVDCSGGASIYKYDPKTTAADVGASVNIGFDITTGGAGLHVGYSWAWSNPGVSYQTSADNVNQIITWVEQFRSPDYTLYPISWTGPTDAAHYSYRTTMSAVMRTPKGSNFYIDHWTSSWRVYDDTLVPYPIPMYFRSITTYTLSENGLGFSSMFGSGGETVIEDFEWGNKGVSLDKYWLYGGEVQWTVSTGGDSVAEIDTDEQRQGEKSARFYYDGTNNLLAKYSKPLPTYRSFYLKRENGGLLSTTNGDGTHRVYILVETDGRLMYRDSGGTLHTVYTIYPGIWYLIELRNINWGDHTYDIYVNGYEKGSGVSMWESSLFNGEVTWQTWRGTGSTWIDDILDLDLQLN